MSAAVLTTATVVLPGSSSEAQAVAALAALAQPARLRVFRALVGAGPDGMTPGVLAATLGVPSSTLSFHLKGLAEAGLVQAERQGRHLVYRPLIAQMNELIAYLTDHCCGGQSCGLATASSASCAEIECWPAGSLAREKSWRIEPTDAATTKDLEA